MLRSVFTIILCLVAHAGAFAPTHHGKTPLVHSTTERSKFSNERSSLLIARAETKKKTGGLDETMRTKLLTESIAPWRTLRLFLYGSLGSGAFIGGLLSGSVAIASSASPEFNLNTELLNLGIDLGAVVLFAGLAKFDLDKQAELQGKVDEKIEKKKERKVAAVGMKEREKTLAALPLQITISSDGATRMSTVAELQRGAKQHMIIVAGPRSACRDALVGANLLKMDFAMSNVLVVPYETGVNQADLQSRPMGGFGERPIYERQPYVAQASGAGWEEYIKAEMKEAVEQNGEKAKEEGIAVVVANNGKVIQRGVGTVPWRQMVEKLEEAINPSPEKPIPFL